MSCDTDVSCMTSGTWCHIHDTVWGHVIPRHHSHVNAWHRDTWHTFTACAWLVRSTFCESPSLSDMIKNCLGGTQFSKSEKLKKFSFLHNFFFICSLCCIEPTCKISLLYWVSNWRKISNELIIVHWKPPKMLQKQRPSMATSGAFERFSFLFNGDDDVSVAPSGGAQNVEIRNALRLHSLAPWS